MESLLTPSNITFILGVLAIIFSIYNYFRNPQVKSEQTDALMSQEIKNLTEKLQLLMNNDIHEIKGMLLRMSGEFTSLSVLVGKLETKLDERVPKK